MLINTKDDDGLPDLEVVKSPVTQSKKLQRLGSHYTKATLSVLDKTQINWAQKKIDEMHPLYETPLSQLFEIMKLCEKNKTITGKTEESSDSSSQIVTDSNLDVTDSFIELQEIKQPGNQEENQLTIIQEEEVKGSWRVPMQIGVHDINEESDRRGSVDGGKPLKSQTFVESAQHKFNAVLNIPKRLSMPTMALKRFLTQGINVMTK